MSYTTKNGCLIYFDPITSTDTHIIDQNTLFLLGLEAVTEEILASVCTCPVCSKCVELNKHLPQDAQQLSCTNSTTLHCANQECNCNKIITRKTNIVIRRYLSEYDITLELYDQISQFLTSHHYDVNCSDTQIQLNIRGLKEFISTFTSTDTSRTVPIILRYFADTDKVNINEDPYICLNNILTFAGYDKTKWTPLFSEYGISSAEELAKIKQLNKEILAEREILTSYSNLYKLLDYQVMYAYALGVLYGCKCIYQDIDIWHQDPASWYTGEYTRLVNSAWQIFRFRYTHPLNKVDDDPNLYLKYKGILINQLWNFSLDDAELLKSDEVKCESCYIDQDGTHSLSLLYSKLTGSLPGSYLLDSNWIMLDEPVLSNSLPYKGIIKADTLPITRYFINTPITLRKAHCYSPNKYLAPASKNYFTSDYSLGWLDFDESLNALTLTKSDLTTILPKLQLARNTIDNSIVSYYKLAISATTTLVGIINSDLSSGVSDVITNVEFDNILLESEFSLTYQTPIILDGYSATSYFNLTSPINLYVLDSDVSLMWTGDSAPVPIVNYGYTLTKSEIIDAYIDSASDEPTSYNLRYNTELGYWSNLWEPRHWSTNLPSDVYNKTTPVTLYLGATLIDQFDLFSNSDTLYIFNNKTNSYLTDLPHGFIPVNELHAIGFTFNQCINILVDDYGNSLTKTDGTPLVWYDELTNTYWNGLLNTWQSVKPAKLGVLMYDSYSNTSTLVNNIQLTEQILLNNLLISYDSFYSNPNYGLISESLSVFKPGITPLPIKCYHDLNRDIYCIPDVTSEWCSKFEIEQVYGYELVNSSSTTLYMSTIQLGLITKVI